MSSITPPDYSGLNMEAMAAAIGLKVKHIPILVGGYLEETKDIIDKLESAIVSQSFDEIENHAHSIKGSSGNLRFSELQELAKSIEFAAKEKDASFAYGDTLDAIKKGFATIKITADSF